MSPISAERATMDEYLKSRTSSKAGENEIDLMSRILIYLVTGSGLLTIAAQLQIAFHIF